MNEVIFLTIDEVLAFHRFQISHYGGASGVRDRGLLESAIATPSSTFDGNYLNPTILSMAAAYLYHLVENHPFIDGNKRIGAMTSAIFLDINGFELTASDDDFTKIVLAVASGKSSKDEVEAFFKANSYLH